MYVCMYVCIGLWVYTNKLVYLDWAHRKFMYIGCYLVVVFVVFVNQPSRSQTMKFM